MSQPQAGWGAVVLTGFMGAGKTTIGRILAQHLGLPFVDCDVLIESRTGRTVRSIFRDNGEEFFRELEHETVRELVEAHDAVIALGGGAVEDARSRELLRQARVVHLHVSYEEALERVRHDTFRPMLNRPDLDEVYLHRRPLYDALAHISVETNGRRPDAIALEVLSRLQSHFRGIPEASSVFVTPLGGAYHAHVGSGIVEHVTELIAVPQEAETALIIESEAEEVFAGRVEHQLASMGMTVRRLPLEDVTEAKTLATVDHVTGAMAELAMHRTDLVVGVGGEAIIDVAGFSASVFNRGMPLVLLPTTLVGQVDSAIGGKSSINVPNGRNLVGSIHQPLSVICDVDVAAEHRDDAGYRAGLAELAKHALISGSAFLHYLETATPALLAADPETLQKAIHWSLRIKSEIVSRDERERGDRAFLNYGHTFAHAFEAEGINPDDGGDALSLGLMAAAYLSHRLGRLDGEGLQVHRTLLQGLGMAIHHEFDLARLWEHWRRDKKYRKEVRFIVLNELGRPERDVTASKEVLQDVMRELAGVRSVAASAEQE